MCSYPTHLLAGQEGSSSWAYAGLPETHGVLWGIIRETKSSTDRSSTCQFALARGQMMIEAKRKSDPIDFLEGLNESRLL